jgi:hypothetical protein
LNPTSHHSYEVPKFNSEVGHCLNTLKALRQIHPQANTGSLEKQIDELVYKIYELTEEEVRIVEGG